MIKINNMNEQEISDMENKKFDEEFAYIKFHLGQIFIREIIIDIKGNIEGNPMIHKMAEFVKKYCDNMEREMKTTLTDQFETSFGTFNLFVKTLPQDDTWIIAFNEKNLPHVYLTDKDDDPWQMRGLTKWAYINMNDK